MKAIFLIARQTIRELIRDRILWAFFGASIVLVIMSLLLGTLSFIEQVKITIDMGLGLIHFLSLCMSLFLGITIVGKELRNRSVYSILARPISRLEYILGKYLGLMGIIGLSCFVLGLALMLLLALLKSPPTQSLFVAILGIFFEMAVVASFALFMSLVVSPVVAAFVSFGWWAAGTFSTDVLFFSSKSDDVVIKALGQGLYYFIPRLDLFQIKNRVVYEPSVPFSEVFEFSAYALTMVAVVTLISLQVFRRKEL